MCTPFALTGGVWQAVGGLLLPPSRLTHLSLAHSGLGSAVAAIFDTLSTNASLRRLDVTGNGLQDAGTIAIAKGTSIRSILVCIMYV